LEEYFATSNRPVTPHRITGLRLGLLVAMSRRTNSATARLRQDYMRIKQDPVPYLTAEPLPSNIREWHYVVTGPRDSLYAGGLYHGKLVFPPEFPFRPPSIYMHTPSGRFKTDTRLCLSISDYHPDTWNPAWTVSTILTGLLSFMLEKSPTLGSVDTSDRDKRAYAANSHEFNLRSKVFVELFPELAEKSKRIVEKRRQKQLQMEEEAAKRQQEGGEGTSGEEGSYRKNSRGAGVFSGAVTNVLVIGGFAAFAFVVQYVLQSIAAAGEE